MAISRASMATPEQVNSGALELIKSGILTVDEIENLFQRFSDENNNAMRRIIARHSLERLDKEVNHKNRERLSVIVGIVNRGAGDILDAWRTLEDTSTRFLGHNPIDGRTDYYNRLAAKWEEVTGDLIESF